MEINRLTPRDIREAIRQLSESEREQLLAERFEEAWTETPAELAAVAEGVAQAERGELIDHADLDAYMAARRKERRRARAKPNGASPATC